MIRVLREFESKLRVTVATECTEKFRDVHAYPLAFFASGLSESPLIQTAAQHICRTKDNPSGVLISVLPASASN